MHFEIGGKHRFLVLLKDYKEAARIRDSLKQFEDEEPVLRLRRLLKEAVAEERFQVSIIMWLSA